MLARLNRFLARNSHTSTMSELQSRLEKIRHDWSHIVSFYAVYAENPQFGNTDNTDLQLADTNLVCHLDSILRHLKEEEDHLWTFEIAMNENVDIMKSISVSEHLEKLSCLKYLLEHNCFALLARQAKADSPKNMRFYVLQLFSLLLSNIRYPLLVNTAFRHPCFDLIEAAIVSVSEGADNQVDDSCLEALIQLVYSLMKSARRNLDGFTRTEIRMWIYPSSENLRNRCSIMVKFLAPLLVRSDVVGRIAREILIIFTAFIIDTLDSVTYNYFLSDCEHVRDCSERYLLQCLDPTPPISHAMQKYQVSPVQNVTITPTDSEDKLNNVYNKSSTQVCGASYLDTLDAFYILLEGHIPHPFFYRNLMDRIKIGMRESSSAELKLGAHLVSCKSKTLSFQLQASDLLPILFSQLAPTEGLLYKLSMILVILERSEVKSFSSTNKSTPPETADAIVNLGNKLVEFALKSHPEADFKVEYDENSDDIALKYIMRDTEKIEGINSEFVDASLNLLKYHFHQLNKDCLILILLILKEMVLRDALSLESLNDTVHIISNLDGEQCEALSHFSLEIAAMISVKTHEHLVNK